MTKKTILLALCSLLLAPCSTVDAQQSGKILRIGFLDANTPSGSAALVEAFRQELRMLGWIEGKNITIEYRFAEGQHNANLSLRRSWFVLRSISLLSQELAWR